MIPNEQVAELKERFKKMGMISYRINGLSEEESLLSYIREKESFRYVFIREPYARSKNLLWRLMKIDIWRPTIPMGYSGMPGFMFDYLGENAIDEAIKIAGLLLHKKYKGRQLDKNNPDCPMLRASFKKIKEGPEKLSPEECDYLDARNVQRIRS